MSNEITNEILKNRHALVVYLPRLIKLRQSFFQFCSKLYFLLRKKMWGNSPGVSSPRYFWTSDVMSTLFLWKKVLNDIIILKDDLVKVSL